MKKPIMNKIKIKFKFRNFYNRARLTNTVIGVQIDIGKR